MKLHCLGTAGYHPSPTRHTASFFLEEANVLLDAGTGVFRLDQLLHGPELSILLSHAHLDHVVGLSYFWDLVSATPLEKIHVYGERRKLEDIRQHLFHPSLFPVQPPLQWHDIEENVKPWKLGEAECEWFPLEHPGGSIGYRLRFPSVDLAYVTDTTSQHDSGYWSKIQGVDWLIHECNFPDSEREMAERTGHSWTSAVLENAYKHGIQRLILTHVNPLADDRDPIGLAAATARLGSRTPSQILLASDSTVVDLSRL
jgi:ribonuclease BN (tRNA processing enzyme)